jgi:hypothetical protein
VKEEASDTTLELRDFGCRPSITPIPATGTTGPLEGAPPILETPPSTASEQLHFRATPTRGALASRTGPDADR